MPVPFIPVAPTVFPKGMSGDAGSRIPTASTGVPVGLQAPTPMPVASTSGDKGARSPDGAPLPFATQAPTGISKTVLPHTSIPPNSAAGDKKAGTFNFGY